MIETNINPSHITIVVFTCCWQLALKRTKMDKITRLHLENVTTQSLMDWVNGADTFFVFASATNKENRIQIGLTGSGMYAVKSKQGITKFKSADNAVGFYREQLLS